MRFRAAILAGVLAATLAACGDSKPATPPPPACSAGTNSPCDVDAPDCDADDVLEGDKDCAAAQRSRRPSAKPKPPTVGSGRNTTKVNPPKRRP